MGIRILNDERSDLACFHCSTSDVAFGPVFGARNHHSALERAEAFLRWITANPVSNGLTKTFGTNDIRLLEANELQAAYVRWLGQEESQFKTEEETAA